MKEPVKPGDVVVLGDDPCLVFQLNGQLRNIILTNMELGSLRDDELNEQGRELLFNIKDLIESVRRET